MNKEEPGSPIKETAMLLLELSIKLGNYSPETWPLTTLI